MDDENLHQVEGSVNDGMDASGMEVPEQEEEEENLIVDPNDPLYGLEQRLKHTSLDDMTKQVIKSRLIDAQKKINENLETRQVNLESKLAPPKKK
jgi:hypothetical protein